MTVPDAIAPDAPAEAAPRPAAAASTALATASLPRRGAALQDSGPDSAQPSIHANDAIVQALDELGEGVLVFQGQRVLSASDGFCRMVGRDRSELLQLSSVFDLVAPEQRDAVTDKLRRSLRNEDDPDRFETTIVRADGARRDVELVVKSVASTTDEAGPASTGPRRPTTPNRVRRTSVLLMVVRDVTSARREARFARVLAEAGEIVAGARDDADAIRAIVGLVVPTLADWCAFDRQDLDGSLTRVAAAHETAAGEALLWVLDRRFPVRQFEGNLRARVLRTSAPLVMNGITDASIRATARNREHAEMLQDLGMGAAVWVPAISLGRTFGILSMGRRVADRPFDAAHLDVAARLGHRAAQAIERSLADRTIRARERQQAAVAELGRLALAGVETDALQQVAARLLAQTLDVEYTTALELQADGQSLRLVAGMGWSAESPGSDEIPLAAAPQAAHTMSSGGPVLVDDVRTETRFAAADATTNAGIVSAMSVVIASRGDRPYGVLSVHTRRRRRFDGDDVNFVQAIANVLATAIERRETEAALRESDERLHLALAASQTGTWEWDLNAGTLYWSDEVKVLYGLATTDPPPSFENYLLMIHPEDRELFQRTVQTALAGESYDLDFRLVMPDGSIRWTNGQGRVFADEHGVPIRMVGTGRDITDRKETEQERDRLLEQERTARLRRDAFIGVLSHELRTPITTVVGGSRLLANRLSHMTTEAAVDLLDDITQEADRLARLIEDLLVLTRSERGDIEPRDDPVLPSMVIDTVVSSSSAVRQRVTLDVGVPRNLPIVIGDETYLEQILRNLIGNAAKFSPPGSTVVVCAEATPTEVLVRVLDEGPGIEPDETDALFEVFYRSPRTRSTAAGSGIGLFVARQLTIAMGGRIWATPRSTGGSEFGLALRRHEIPDDDLEAD